MLYLCYRTSDIQKEEASTPLLIELYDEHEPMLNVLGPLMTQPEDVCYIVPETVEQSVAYARRPCTPDREKGGQAPCLN